MSDAVYCFCSSEPQANAILTHLREAGMSSGISVLLQDSTDTRNISLKENALRGAGIGSAIGASLALIVPGVGSVLALGLLGGAAAGGIVGGLVGGSGGLAPLDLPQAVANRLHRVANGDILIAVHSEDSAVLRTAVQFFKDEGAEDIYEEPALAA
jgi:hypothetical protein